MIYVVIDTNVVVSAFLTKNSGAATVKILDAIYNKIIVPLYHDEIYEEYKDVLNRERFHFSKLIVNEFLKTYKNISVKAERVFSGESFIDPDDVVFYEVALSKNNTYLVTGNTKHFPRSPIVVTHAELMELI
ncbi:MAG: putative toxin-antitoxin system toxin component, PIN family [Paludibacteraceae bacterium]|nr:putative toxin-antitoxin system toxin component, PIN family [Paludibacteraceae bacterium]